MDEETFVRLLSSAGQALLARAELEDLSDAARLRTLTRLRRDAPPALAIAAYDTAVLRRRAQPKFRRAGAMYFTREALEQATGETVARHRARRFAGYERVVDLGCGVGGDALALAAGARVAGIDRDPLRLRMARENAAAYEVGSRLDWVRADITDGGPARAEAAFVDPARRTATGRRVFDANAYEPPLGRVLGWSGRFRGMAVKAAPGIADEDIADLPGEVEFVSESGDLKEAVLWLGELGDRGRRATLLPDGATLHAEVDSAAPVAPAGPVLYEPDAAVIRAHLLGTLAGMLGAWQIDPTIAYLSADEWRATPFARGWRIESVLPFSEDGVRRRLRSLGVGRLTVKKRGSPIEPEAFIRAMRLAGTEERTVVLTRQLGRPVAIICTGPIIRR